MASGLPLLFSRRAAGAMPHRPDNGLAARCAGISVNPDDLFSIVVAHAAILRCGCPRESVFAEDLHDAGLGDAGAPSDPPG